MTVNPDFTSLQERQGFWYGFIFVLTVVSALVYLLVLRYFSSGGGEAEMAHQLFIVPIVIASVVMGRRGFVFSVGIVSLVVGMNILMDAPVTFMGMVESSLVALGVSGILVAFSTTLETTKSSYDSLFAASPAPVLVIDAAMRLKDMNEKAAGVLGISEKDLNLPLFRPDGPFGDMAETSDALQHQVGEQAEGAVEFHLTDKDGVFRVMKAFIQPVRQKDGTCIGSILFLADITREVQTLMALHSEQDRFCNFFDEMVFGAGIYRKTEDGFSIIDMNPKACVMNNVMRAQVVGRFLHEFGYFSDDANGLRAVMDTVVETGVPAEFGPVAYTRMESEEMRKYYLFLIGTGEVVIIQVDYTQQIVAQERILASLEEKDTMIKEIHHRVKNNLQMIASLLGLQLFRTNDAVTREILNESRNMVYSMSMTHEKLYRSRDLAGIEVGEYIGSLADHLVSNFSSAGRTQVEVVVDCNDTLTLNIDAGIPCGLILNELITNSLKYAFTGLRNGEIRISFQECGDAFVLEYRDNGQGMEGSSVPEEGDSLGMEIIETLTEQLDGTMEVTSGPWQGVCYRISFPTEGHC